MTDEKISFIAVGDVGPDRENPESLFEHAASTIREADISFCQLERILSNRGDLQVQIKAHHSRVDPANVSAMTSAGFNLLSFASNHSLDWGAEAFLDTIELLRGKGIEAVGVGRNIQEARRPVILDRDGTRIAFLGYCSVLPRGYQAEAETPGCAPLRAKTFYEQVDWQAGTPPEIITFTEAGDLDAMVGDISRAKAMADSFRAFHHCHVSERGGPRCHRGGR
jgi:poly-gamma-glutamate capsule biosynthesis protein CapA/YwtB (metallophosphatase superfamily)